MNTSRLVFALAVVCGCGMAYADDDHDSRTPEKSVSCSSNDGHRNVCAADLRGYAVRDVDQFSRTQCVVGRNWGYTDRGVWVDDGCRAEFIFTATRDHDRRDRYSERDIGPHRR